MSHHSCNCSCNRELDCNEVSTCLNSTLGGVANGTDTSLDNFCEAVATCVDAQFEAIANGESNDFDNFGLSIIKILQSVSGYSDSGDVYLYSTNGTLAWTSVSIGHSYVQSGTGITVTGDGSFSNQYTPNINSTYVKNLFSATNGLTYTAGIGSTKLGGTLTENTTIAGATFNLTVSNLTDLSLAASGTTFLKVADYTSATNGDVLTLVSNSTGEVEWSTPNSFSGSFIQNQQAVAQVANYRILGNGWVGLKFTAGDVNQITDTSHYFKGVGFDLYPVVVHNSLGQELLTLSNFYLKIPDGTINPTPAFAAPFHEGSMYYNTSTDNFVGYRSGAWNNFVFDTRSISTSGSISGGGDFSANRTFSLVNDSSTPGSNKYYGTDGTGTKGWFTSSGGVTSVGLSVPSILSVSGGPITGSGTLSITLPSQSANTFFAGPSSGSAASPTFRTLTSADIPNDTVNFSQVQDIASSKLLGRTTAGSGDIEQLSVGSHLVLSSGVLNAVGRTLVNVTAFSSTGTWIKDSKTNSIMVVVVAAGGGGGAVTGLASEAAAAGGGGAGGFSINYITTGFGNSESVVVGTGGAGGVAGNNAGSTGGTSSFGSLVSVTGGAGGSAMTHGTTGAIVLGGNAGTVSTSSGVSFGSGGSAGGHGTRLTSSVAVSGGSGSSYYNGSTNSRITSGVGANGSVSGAGGSGAVSINSIDTEGGSGANGLVLVYEFS